MSTLSLTPSPLDRIEHVGKGLNRPECVLCTASGAVFTADWRGGVACTRADGHQDLWLAELPSGAPLRPNGMALLSDGSFLLAQLGESDGGVYRLWRDGRLQPWLTQVDGQALPPTNFVLPDGHGRTWVTVSTRQQPRALGYRPGCNDGFIVRVDADGSACIVADGLGYTNEVAMHPSGRWLYVNETFARRLSRFELDSCGRLGPRQTVTEFGAACFPDGLAFDVEGNAWVVSIVSNRLIRVAPDGKQLVWLEDSDAAHLASVEAAYRGGSMGREHLDQVPSQVLRSISSIAFGGADRRTAHLGCLLGDRIATLRLPVAGAPLPHWNF